MQNASKIPGTLPADYRPTGAEGLSEAQVAERRAMGYANKETKTAGRSPWQIVAANLFTLFNLLNVALALCLAQVGSYRNMLFMGVVVSNTLIGTVQELRAHRVISRLKLLNAARVRVIREGEERSCLPEELVRDELIVLERGDQVPGDAVVRFGVGAANEALLTGESESVGKVPGDWLLSGSYVSEGRIIAQLVYVGEESYAAKLTRAARKIKRPKSMLMQDLNKLIRFVAVIIVPIGAALFAKQYVVEGADLAEAVTGSVAAMIGMIPEGLALLTSVAMAVGVVRLGRHNTLTQELYGIETLARIDVLCLDKTGTITTGEMELEELIPLDLEPGALREALSRFLGAFPENTPTLNALRRAVPVGVEEPVSLQPFSSVRKHSWARFGDGNTIVLGAPGFLPQGIDGERVRQAALQSTARGRRVMVLGIIDAQGIAGAAGLIVLSEEVRENAADTIAYFARQGVQVKVISGDDPVSVSAIARKVGVRDGDRWVDASTLSEEDMDEACRRYTVFGRVTPLQKKQLVNALKRAGHSVGMTGDGVNDIPALKAADCSIAMAGGSDAAAHAAQLILLDSDFAHMPVIVAEGRRVINNITRSACLFLMKTLYSFALSLILLLLPAAYPFQPIQLTLISTLTIGLPGFFLSLERNEERVKGSFLRTVLYHALPGAVAVTFCASAAMILERYGLSQELCSTLATLSAAILGLVQLAGVCLPLTPLRLSVLLGSLIGLVCAVLLVPELFYLVPVGPREAIPLALLVAGGVALRFAVRRLLRWMAHLQKSRSARKDA